MTAELKVICLTAPFPVGLAVVAPTTRSTEPDIFMMLPEATLPAAPAPSVNEPPFAAKVE